MNKEIRSAASLRCSARMKIREEWSRLKESDNLITSPDDKQSNVLSDKINNIGNNEKKQNTASKQLGSKFVVPARNTRKLINNKPQTSDVLRGVVALVDVGGESRALALRAALTALGASIVPKWSPLVTHLIWSQGGDRSVRAKARALACRLVSPLWVEACASSATRLPEQAFPAAPRPSDLPSPRTLKQLLKKVDMENIPIFDLLSDNKDEKEVKEMRLRISSETEGNTSSDVNTTKDTTLDKSTDKSHDKSAQSTDVETRVNTAPRRVLPMSLSTSPQEQEQKKSRRKLFTQKDPDLSEKSSDESEAESRHPRVALAPRRDLAKAQRMARDLLAAATNQHNNKQAHTQTYSRNMRVRIVLTGMNSKERQSVSAAIRSLGGRIQTSVNKKTTHVLLGSCQENNPDITGVTIQSGLDKSFQVQGSGSQKARTLNALLGAARGCRVLHAQWAIHSAAENKWLHHLGYEVAHLKKISQKARVERTALGLQHSDYFYDVFAGTRILVTNEAQQRNAAIQLLTVCGAFALDAGLYQNGGATQNGGQLALPAKSQIENRTQDGRQATGDFDIRIGVEPGEVSSKWVFDSVASARMRTTRKYINSG